MSTGVCDSRRARVRYSTNTALLPSHLKTVAIPVFENATTEYTLEQEITDAVIARFVADNHLQRGRRALRRRGDPRQDHGLPQLGVRDLADRSRAQEYRVTISVQVTFKDQVKNREIWTRRDRARAPNYYVRTFPAIPATTEVDGRKLAVARRCHRNPHPVGRELVAAPPGERPASRARSRARVRRA